MNTWKEGFLKGGKAAVIAVMVFMLTDPVSVKAAEDYSQPLPSDYKGTLTMWGWDDPYYECITTAFQEKYPNVTFEYTPMVTADIFQKYQNTIVAGTPLPDVAWAVIDSRAKVFELDMWEDLSAEPYNFDMNDCFSYVHKNLVNSRGEVCGIEQCVCPSGLAYRRDLALEYFGTDDPEKLKSMFPTWEAFIEKGIEVYEKSGGEVYMMRSISDAKPFFSAQSGEAWVEGNTIQATKALKRIIELSVKFRDHNICDDLETWSTEWQKSISSDKYIFVGCATWMIPYRITPNDPEGETLGHWGLMSVPEGNISWGGTTLGISKTCKDKRLAWEFIKFATLSADGARALNKISFMTSAVAPYEDVPEICTMTSPWFGEQDLGEIFLDGLASIETRTMWVDEVVVDDTLNLILKALNEDPGLSADEAFVLFTEELKLQLPKYTIE